MIIILIGVSGSGKTTIGKRLSEETSWPFYDADDFHSKSSKEKMQAGIPLKDADRLPWLKELVNLIQKHAKENKSMILACSALKSSYLDLLNVSPECHFVFLKGAYELIKSRLEKRKEHFFNPKLLKSQFETLEEPKNVTTFDVHLSVEEIVQAIKVRFQL